MVSTLNIYTVHLKYLNSIRYPLNQYKTLTKNFNHGLNSSELVWKMAKSKHQKQHSFKKFIFIYHEIKVQHLYCPSEVF